MYLYKSENPEMGTDFFIAEAKSPSDSEGRVFIGHITLSQEAIDLIELLRQIGWAGPNKASLENQLNEIISACIKRTQGHFS